MMVTALSVRPGVSGTFWLQARAVVGCQYMRRDDGVDDERGSHTHSSGGTDRLAISAPVGDGVSSMAVRTTCCQSEGGELVDAVTLA